MLCNIKRLIQNETVLCISAFTALVTMLWVPPDSEYLNYIDFRVLCLLFCLMAVINGLKNCGVFEWMTAWLLKFGKRGRVLDIVLVMIPFFLAMLITNDVALLTIVPFTIMLLNRINQKRAIAPILVMQTLAANLGSMATPVGNPQNLFLYAAYDIKPKEFFYCILPLVLISMLCLIVAALPVLPAEICVPQIKGRINSKPKLLLYIVLFVLCLLTVFRMLPYVVLAVAVLCGILAFDKSVLKRVDYCLLLTFVCFFIISANLGRIEFIREFLQQLLCKDTLLTAIGASQFISNVPAAVLLSEFTDNWKALLQGVNIGGLGTPVASLASLITLKFYMAQPDAKPGKFLITFTAANLVGLAILITAEVIIY